MASSLEEANKTKQSGALEGEASGVRQRPAGDLIDERYFVKRTLGQGGMGSVYLVEDLQTGRSLALKQMRSDRANPKSLSTLKNEFLSLAPLKHPNIARVYNFGFDQSTEEYYFTSEFVEGTQLLKATRNFDLSTAEDLKRVIDLMVGVLRALEFVHSRGFVHGDLKPENILVEREGVIATEENAELDLSHALKVIDFGLTKKEKEFGDKRVFGTSYYVAPETILGSQIDRRTDLYSIGIVFYQLLTRMLPFVGDSNLVILKEHLEVRPRPLHEVVSAVPWRLSKIILRLVEKKPAERYESAAEVIRALNEDLSLEVSLETPTTMRSYINSTRCIGRDDELRELFSFFHSVVRFSAMGGEEDVEMPPLQMREDDEAVEFFGPPRGHFFLIRGEQGIGKKRLIREFRGFVEVRGASFFDFEIDETLAAENGNLRRVLEFLSSAFAAESRKLRENGSRAELVSKSLRDVLDCFEGSLDDQVVEKLSPGIVQAFKAVPLVLSFNGLHLAEDALLNFLRSLVSAIVGAQDEKPQVLILAAARDEELEADAFRRLLLSVELRSHFREIVLERLSLEDVEKLLETMFGRRQFSPVFTKRVFEESDGNPEVVHEILDYFISKNQLKRDFNCWLYTGDIAREVIPGKVRTALREKIQSLEPESMRLGLAFAFLGNSCELEFAIRMAEIPSGKILESLLTLKRQGLLREDGEGSTDRFSFTHRSARELFLQQVSTDECALMHLRAGMLLEERLQSGVISDPRLLSYHFLRAGRTEAGARYGHMAARAYTAKQLPRKALEVYREIRLLARTMPPEKLREVDCHIALLEGRLGNTEKAVQILDRSIDEIDRGLAMPGTFSRPDLLIYLAELECRLGRLKKSSRCLRDAFDFYKHDTASPGLVRILHCYARLFFLQGNFIESRRYCERIENAVEKLPDDISRALYFLLLAENCFQMDNVERAAKHCRKAIAVLDESCEIGAAAYTLFSLGKFYVYKGKLEWALSQFQTCIKIFHNTGIRVMEGECRRHIGALQLSLDIPKKACEELSEALEHHESTSYLWGVVDSLRLLGEAYRRVGRYEEAGEFLHRALTLNRELDNSKNEKELEIAEARLCLDRGDFEKASELVDRPVTNNPEWNEHEEMAVKRLELQCQIALNKGEFRIATDLTALGMILAQDVSNKVRVAPLIQLRIQLYLCLGRYPEIRRNINELYDIGKSYGLKAIQARAAMLEGRLLHLNGDYSGSSKLLGEALEDFKARETERDLAELYLDFGLVHLHGQNFEQSYLLFEEGAYLAKKLHLVYLRCRFSFAMGRLESRMKEGNVSQATTHLKAAENVARRYNFQEVLWQIYYYQGRLLIENDKISKARGVLVRAMSTFKQVIERVPESFQDSYVTAREAYKLLNLVDEFQTKTEA